MIALTVVLEDLTAVLLEEFVDLLGLLIIPVLNLLSQFFYLFGFLLYTAAWEECFLADVRARQQDQRELLDVHGQVAVALKSDASDGSLAGPRSN